MQTTKCVCVCVCSFFGIKNFEKYLWKKWEKKKEIVVCVWFWLESDEKEIENLTVPYLSPLALRNQVSDIIANFRLDLNDIDDFRIHHDAEFWNLIWFCYNRKLSLTFLLGDLDATHVIIKPFMSDIIPLQENKEDAGNCYQSYFFFFFGGECNL